VSTREHYPGQLWLTDQDADLLLLEDPEAFEVYVVHVDDRGITYELEGFRYFSPWSSVISISVRV